MPPSQVSAQDIEGARVAVVLIVASVTVFWRFALRATLAIIVVAAILGLLVLAHGVR
jgi:hypothetical protein